MNLKDYLIKNQELGLPYANYYRKDFDEVPLPEDIKLQMDSQLRDQKHIMNLLAPEAFIWIVYSGVEDITEFLSYYSRVLPKNTRAIVLLDRLSPKPAKEVKDLFEAVWTTLFLEIPENCTYSFVRVQLYYFSYLFNRLGKWTWNLFVDVDEFLPLPKEHPTFSSLFQLLDSKNITQLCTTLLDTWELRKNGISDMYFDSMEEEELQNNLDLHLSKGWWLTDNQDLPFLETDGKRRVFYNFFRNKVLGITSYDDILQKTVLVKRTDNNYLYSLSNHEPFSFYRSENEFLVRYPLIHKKFLRDIYPKALASVFKKEKQIKELGRNTNAWADHFYWVDALEELNKQVGEGFGPYKVLGDHDDDSLFRAHGFHLSKLSELVDNDLTFSLKDFPYQSMYPFLNVDPLL